MLYYVEVTDTFGGEANYSWVTRHVFHASSMRGAVSKFGKMSGMSWRLEGDYGDQRRYDSKSGATCYFIEGFDEEKHGELRFDTDER